ncbi:16S rRNA (adenine(1518)-N(6)/adenine(1519)-N(6))-dimethyltransferase RsmA [Maricaulis sp. D1M11]|uniref:16S rRNA (adenine(1518)-N(6)/adenine(1519)-N(6))- dimethyltransferase RsmA n=1 Tax=Maricaulis sp. D1M11 TaxID=3076117 RepID=UPI0039B3FBF2
MTPDQLPPLRDVIAQHDLGAKKTFGQHFLLDLNLTAKIARLAGDMSDKHAIEIGPGPGGLTRAILAEGARHLTLVEKDPRFLPALAEVGAAYPGQLDIVEGDALEVDETRFMPAGQSVILSNLPYNVGTHLMIKWLESDPIWWTRAVLMFQREVADRIVARVGEKAYGRLAILSQSRASVRLALKVTARAFTPPPKVESAVIVVDPLPADQRFEDLKALEAVTASAFGQRRKILRRSLAQAAHQASTPVDSLIEAAGLDPSARAETIDIEGFQALARAWRAARG